MPTFDSRLRLFFSQYPDFKFSKKKLHTLHGAIKNVFDKRKRENQVIEYVKSDYGDYNVRVYPESFTPTIDGLIRKFHYSATHPVPNLPKKIKEPKPKKVYNKKEKEPRKKIPVKKPVYSPYNKK